jgi:hypothetical protein
MSCPAAVFACGPLLQSVQRGSPQAPTTAMRLLARLNRVVDQRRHEAASCVDCGPPAPLLCNPDLSSRLHRSVRPRTTAWQAFEQRPLQRCNSTVSGTYCAHRHRSFSSASSRVGLSATGRRLPETWSRGAARHAYYSVYNFLQTLSTCIACELRQTLEQS